MNNIDKTRQDKVTKQIILVKICRKESGIFTAMTEEQGLQVTSGIRMQFLRRLQRVRAAVVNL